MTFLVPDDFKARIKADILNLKTQNDTATLDKAEAEAIEEMKEFLRMRFDIEALFTQTATNRNTRVVRHCVSIVIKNLSDAGSYRDQPEVVERMYAEAIGWLNACANGDISPDLPLRSTDQYAESLKLGGSHKFVQPF